ncbi:ABC transporter permease [Ureibacillus massiliensis 4400831 = CIP 108448 = CCUG 49529]|uniref:ABC transporter permease n=2 Tax=cellular organisms TaxID=131567 RepID=A0A0A3J2X0_9BACL|nr:ABC transporter permease [Ureibacillus massiliensis]KGR89538.1 ABC transporter permease [Ureibacillus massiliensis 4400831 = CIP 108448 = CCUG 49529]
MELIPLIIVAAISGGTSLLFAILGGILNEKAGVINLGAEGIMLVGAVMSAVTFLQTKSLISTFFIVLIIAGILGLLHAFLCITLRVNQIVSGLAITLFGSGLSAYIGKSVAGAPIPVSVPKVEISFIEQIPVIGQVLSSLDIFIWLSIGLAIILYIYMYKTSWGLHLKAVGDNPATSDATGISVIKYKYLHVIAGSMLMGLAGFYLIMVYSTSWMEGMTSGRGWIAVALVIFARWNPLLAIFAAYFFGGLDSLGFRMQLFEIPIPSYFLKMVPYIATIIVLMIIGWKNRHKPSIEPKSLGMPYTREQRF